VESEVISLRLEGGKNIFYAEEDGKKYSVYPTEERFGGNLMPAEILISDGELLCFASCGEIFLFNNDMRGVAPEEIKSEKNFDEKEYERLYGNKIHPGFYSFMGHAPSYVIATAYDSCGLLATENSSSGESLCLKLKIPKKTSLTVSVITNKGIATKQTLTAVPCCEKNEGYEKGIGIIGLTERAHGWLEKQIIIEGNEFSSPFGLCALAFKYQLKEKLKKG
jgi:hypothetical protein